VVIIPACCRAVTSLDSRKSRNFFPGIEKKDGDSSLVNIPTIHASQATQAPALQKIFNEYTVSAMFPCRRSSGTLWHFGLATAQQ